MPQKFDFSHDICFDCYLTERQEEILRLKRKCKTNKQIGILLNYSERTINNDVHFLAKYL